MLKQALALPRAHLPLELYHKGLDHRSGLVEHGCDGVHKQLQLALRTKHEQILGGKSSARNAQPERIEASRLDARCMNV